MRAVAALARGQHKLPHPDKGGVRVVAGVAGPSEVVPQAPHPSVQRGRDEAQRPTPAPPVRLGRRCGDSRPWSPWSPWSPWGDSRSRSAGRPSWRLPKPPSPLVVVLGAASSFLALVGRRLPREVSLHRRDGPPDEPQPRELRLERRDFEPLGLELLLGLGGLRRYPLCGAEARLQGHRLRLEKMK